jgi:hypothetical protein
VYYIQGLTICGLLATVAWMKWGGDENGTAKAKAAPPVLATPPPISSAAAAASKTALHCTFAAAELAQR